MRYAIARYQRDQRELAYRVFVTDGIMLGAQGKYISKRYIDTISKPPEDARSGIEIAHDILSRAGLEVTSD